MNSPARYRVIDRVRRIGRPRTVDFGPEELARARGPHLPDLPVVGGLMQSLSDRVTGRPRTDVVTEPMTVPGAVGDLGARRHEPRLHADRRPLVLHLHGGGWVVGAAVQYDWICTELAVGLDAVVISVDYRLAPEHPAPAAADDARAVIRWLLEQGGVEELGAQGPVVVCGDSAGGNLAALVAVEARDRRFDGLAAQLLIYPGTDLTATMSSAVELTDEPFLGRQDLDDFLALYLTDEVRGDDPRVAPHHVEDLSGVAPACIVVAEWDPLRDEGVAFAHRLEEAGVPTRLTEYVDVPHGFVSLPGVTSQARQAVAELVAFARRQLDD